MVGKKDGAGVVRGCVRCVRCVGAWVMYLFVEIPLLVEEGEAIQGLVRSNLSYPGEKGIVKGTATASGRFSYKAMHTHT